MTPEAVLASPASTDDQRAIACGEIAMRDLPPLPVPRWLDEVLARAAVLDLTHPDARRELATALIVAASDDNKAAAIVEIITDSARAVLEEKIARTVRGACVIVDAEYAPRIAREIGRNAAHAVLLVHECGDAEAA